MKTVSIITTIYNPSIEGLKATLESVLHQNYSGIVHYLYNDGSKDRAFVKVINEYIKDVQKLEKPFVIKFIDCKENLGVDKAHFNCFKMVDTDFFMWLDCSDYLEDNFFNKISNFLDLHFGEYQCFHFNSFEFDKGLIKTIPTSASFSIDKLREKKQFGNFLSKKNWFWHSFLVDAKAYRRINSGFVFVDKSRHGGFFYDGQILWALCLANCNFYFFDDVYSYIEKPPLSVSTGYKYNHEKIHEIMMELLFSFNFDNKFDRARQTLAFFDNRLIYKKFACLKRKKLQSEIKRTLSFYSDDEISPILFPKKQVKKLLVISKNYFLYKHFLKKHKGEIEKRSYFF